MRLAFASLNRKESLLKFAAVAIGAMLVITSAVMLDVSITAKPLNTSETGNLNRLYKNRRCHVESVLTADGSTWVSFDSSPPGTPAEAHVTISDTSGITIVGDFHGFWRTKVTINGTEYDDLTMPGASSIDDTGKPVLPRLFEYLEIPHDVDTSVEVLAASSDYASGYSIRPAPAPVIPSLVNDSSLTNRSTPVPAVDLDPVYSINAFFPGNTTSTEGGTNATSMIMRGHRLLGLSFYPVQYNPVNTTLEVFSQIVIKVKYSVPAQIEPVPERLRSTAFESILATHILNYGSCGPKYKPQPGVARMIVPPVYPLIVGAEYLIITTQEFKHQADRLAEWKERKGVRSIVWVVNKDAREEIKQSLENVYNAWLPAPTYVLIMGDVEFIPACYDAKHSATYYNTWLPDRGYIASDLGYFNIEGNGFLPDMIYGRMSVDTPEQAEIVVNKTLQYEQSPPYNPLFYTNTLFAGYFHDRKDGIRDGVEDDGYSFIYSLERIRHHLKTMYTVHVNYSSAYMHYRDLGITLADLKFNDPISIPGSATTTYYVADSISPDYPDFQWIGGYNNDAWPQLSRANVSPNFNEGRFLVLYFDHGGSENMIWYNAANLWNEDPEYLRDYIEGWDNPYYDTSFFSDMTNGNLTPLFISIACSTGWYDGEVDEDYLFLGDIPPGLTGSNLFEDYATECFAEEITRLEGGGAVAAISASRLAISDASGHLMDGLIQAFWPGHLGSTNHPVYEMGAALLFGKLYVSGDSRLSEFKVRTTFEEYNLFGDPETQLWTGIPSNFSVSYPVSVGTSDPQRFVVTVRNKETGFPVNFAKVCIRQEGPLYPLYQVGYTNTRGQVTFNVKPSSTPSHINVTVTKHNYRPHIGNMSVHESYAGIYIWPPSGTEFQRVNVSQTGFPEVEPVWVYFDDEHVETLEPGVVWKFVDIPSGHSGFINVWLAVPNGDMVDWSPISVERLGRRSLAEGPDPYIYTRFDSSTWDVTGGDFSWDNPDIAVSDDTVTVTVHNRGSDSTVGTQVTLSYAPHLGGMTWHEVETKTLPGVAGEISFTLSPLPQSGCLRVDLSHEDENPVNEFNNIGFDVSGIIEMSSPGIGRFHVGNPSGSPKYVSVDVKQLGNHSDVWNATVQDYSSRILNPGLSEGVTLFVDSLRDLESDEFRLFEVEFFIDCRCVGGMILNATGVARGPIEIDPTLIIGMAIGAAVVIAGVVIVHFIRKRG